MEASAIIVMLLVLLALVGVVVFFVYDYIKHKDSNETTFNETDKRIDVEKTDRLSNLKFVVDQINEVNNDIYTTMSSNVLRLDEQSSNVLSTQNNMVAGFDKFIRFSSNNIPGAPQVNLLDLPGTGSPNVELIQHVTAMMGMTVNDLGAGVDTNKVKFCNIDGTRCVRIPDDAGNTVLTGMTDNGRVIVDGALRAYGDIEFIKKNGNDGVKLSADGKSMFIHGDRVGISGGSLTDPQAKLHVKADANQAPFKLSVSKLDGAASDALLVSATGELTTTGPIVLKKSMNDVTNVATFSAETVNDTHVLTLKTHRMHIDGNLSVSGTIVSNANAEGVSRLSSLNVSPPSDSVIPPVSFPQYSNSLNVSPPSTA